MIEIRGAADPDKQAIGEIVAAATGELRAIYRPRSEAPPPDAEEALSLVAVAGGIVVGVVDYLLRDDSLYLRGLAVHPDWRRQGVARSLLATLARLALESGRDSLTLATIQETGNPALFERLGFERLRVVESPRFVTPEERPVHQVEMIRRLTPKPKPSVNGG